MRNVGHQFHKIQRTSFLQEESTPGSQPENPQTEMVSSLTAQIGRLEERLADKEELIDLYVENSFEVQTQLAAKEEETNMLKTELQTVTHRDQQELLKIQQLENTYMQQLEAKRKEAVELQQQVQELTEQVTLREGSKSEENRTAPPQIDMTMSMVARIAKLEAKLANAEELIDLYVEHSFETQTQLIEKKIKKIDRSRKEIQTLTHKNLEILATTRKLEETQSQQLETRDTKITALQKQIQEFQANADTHNLQINEIQRI